MYVYVYFYMHCSIDMILGVVNIWRYTFNGNRKLISLFCSTNRCTKWSKLLTTRSIMRFTTNAGCHTKKNMKSLILKKWSSPIFNGSEILQSVLTFHAQQGLIKGLHKMHACMQATQHIFVGSKFLLVDWYSTSSCVKLHAWIFMKTLDIYGNQEIF